MMNPIISILIPVYNGESHIVQCLESVRSQSMKDIEIVISDDASTDNTILVIQEYSDKHPDLNIKLLQSDNNRGVAHGRNKCISNAVGEYIYFLDSDDFISPNALKELYTNISGLNFITGLHIGFMDELNQLPETGEFKVYSGSEIFPAFVEGNWNGVTVWNKLINRKFIINNKLYFDEDMRFHEDYIWNFLLALKAKRVGVLHHFTYYYNDNPHSITNNLKIESNLKGYIQAFNKIRDLFIAKGFNENPLAYKILEGKKSGVLYSLLEVNQIGLYNKYYTEFSDSCIISPFSAWRKGMIGFGYLLRDLNYCMPSWLGKKYKCLFYFCAYRWRGKKIKGAIWS